MSKRKQNSFRPSLTLLENREVPAVSTITLSGGILTVDTNSAATNVLVSQPVGSITIKDVTTNRAWSYSSTKVNEVIVNAGAGTDTFTATTTHPATAKLVEFIGGKGTDTFLGESGPVSMQAGSGSDTLTATAGNDTLVGGGGTDYIKGGSGDDLIEAGTGSDYLNGGTGIATIVAGVGDDTIVAMNGQATDTIYTGIGTAVIWEDSIGGVTDTIIGNTAGDTIQAVPGFTNAGPTNVLNGGTFAEPTPLAGNSYEAFTSRPLFASGGPTAADVKQYINPAGGGVGGTGTNLDDSWLLAGLAAIAREDPATIEQNVVSFGDGTYGVKLGDEYFRVDDKLPVNVAGETFTAYASVGLQNSLWVPIVEKAFAYYATPAGTPSYSNLLAVNGGTTPDVYAAFGATSGGSEALNGVGGFANANDLGQSIEALLNSNFSTCVGLTTGVAGTSLSTGLAVNLVADREYTVLSYSVGFNGNVTSVVLRDPDGTNSTGVTVTLANLYASSGTLDFGNP
jgi:hypothetical protein